MMNTQSITNLLETLLKQTRYTLNSLHSNLHKWVKLFAVLLWRIYGRCLWSFTNKREKDMWTNKTNFKINPQSLHNNQTETKTDVMSKMKVTVKAGHHMPPIGKGGPFYSHLYHGHRVSLLLSKDSHPEIQEGKRETHMVNGCCSCCCAPGQTESECQCFVYYCYDSEQVAGPFDHQGYPTAARETSSSDFWEKIQLVLVIELNRWNLNSSFVKQLLGKKIMQFKMHNIH